MAGILRVAQGHINGSWLLAVSSWQLPTLVDDFDDGAQRTVRDDALGARLHRLDKGRLLAVPTTEGTKTEGLANPQHVVAIASLLLVVVGIELRFLQFQLFFELAIEVERLTGIEIDTDAVQLALEVHAVVVLDIIGIGRIATSRQRFDIVVLLVLLQLFVLGIAQHHLCKYAGRIWARLTLVVERHAVLLFLLLVDISQKAQLVEGLVLVEVVQLTGHFLSVQRYQCRTHFTIVGQINNNRYVRASNVHGVADADGNRPAGRGCGSHHRQQAKSYCLFHFHIFSRFCSCKFHTNKRK